MDADRDHVTLCPADGAAVDALLDAPGGPDSEVSEEQRQRQARVQGWLQVVGTAPVPEMRGDLAARTLAAVQADRMYVGPSRPAVAEGKVDHSKTWAQWRRRAAVIGSMGVAAALLVAVAVEGLGTVRRSQARMACAANLHTVGVGFDSYASASNGELPMLAVPPNHNWLYGNSETAAKNNAANLVPLVGSYVALKELICAGTGATDASKVKVGRNAIEGISYSYRNISGADKPRWDHSHSTIVMADRNPVFAAALARPGVEESNSLNHGGLGSYVLRADTVVTWETSPNMGPDHDNIWTLGSGTERAIIYKGTEVPGSIGDVMVCP